MRSSPRCADAFQALHQLAVGLDLVRGLGSGESEVGGADERDQVREVHDGAAIGRRTRSGAVVGATERLTPAAAIDALPAGPADLDGPPRRVEPGAPADLVLLHGPAGDLPTAFADPVRAVLIDGMLVR